jgi:hypothetical protein
LPINLATPLGTCALVGTMLVTDITLIHVSSEVLIDGVGFFILIELKERPTCLRIVVFIEPR